MAEEKTSAGWMDQAREFIKDVRVESGRVSWPTRLELRDSTFVVIAMVLLVSAFLFFWDRIFALLMNLLFTGGGR
ncbi:MAG: preprotein translocase subunit SecE [Candidatus Eisenbacteria bacterium]